MVWYRAGSMDEKDGTSGVAHVLEHLMFKGTKTSSRASSTSAWPRPAAATTPSPAATTPPTSRSCPKAALPEMMKLEADRMANLVLEPKEFASGDQGGDGGAPPAHRGQSDSLVHEKLNWRPMFQAHPYRRPIIGWMDDLEHMTWQDARDWYRQWYAPNNAYVVVVGDVDHREVFRLAQKHYGAHKPKALPERKPQNEPEQAGIRRVSVKAPAKLPYLAMAWKMPKLRDVHKDRDPYALDVLAAVLDGHDAARFSKNLVRGSRASPSRPVPAMTARLRGEASFMRRRPAGGGARPSPSWRRRCVPRSSASRTKASPPRNWRGSRRSPSRRRSTSATR
jgi:zinc protease